MIYLVVALLFPVNDRLLEVVHLDRNTSLQLNQSGVSATVFVYSGQSRWNVIVSDV